MSACFIHSPVGMLCIQEEAEALIGLRFAPGQTPLPPSSPLLREASSQLAAYFAGKLRRFSLPLRPEGTPFMRAVWDELLRIPYGETASYKEIARRAGRPLACRAVGQANHRNPLAIVIPCHRVIGRDGRLTGYAGGLEVKKALLSLEGQRSAV